MARGTMQPHLVIRAALFLGLAGAIGCSGGTASVTGTVTFDGKPVTTGSVIFYSDSGRVDSGLLDADGKYSVPRAPVGVVKVAVKSSMGTKAVGGRAAPPSGPPGGKGKQKKASSEEGKPPPETTVVKSLIPERYSDPEQSGLIYTIKSGNQVIDIDLKP